MLLAKLLRLLAACLLALFALGANARAMDDLQNQNTLLEKIELLPLDGPHAWLAQAVDSPEGNTCVYGAFVSEPTHYNYFRSYQAAQGRYTQADPIGLDGGLNRFAYVDANPLMDFDLFGLIGRLGNGLDQRRPEGGGGGPNFAVSPGGTVFPIPSGARGPVPVVNPGGKVTGGAFTGGSGGSNGQVCNARFMDPTPARGSSPGYPNGYVKYENANGQGVDPYSGKTLPHSQAHFPR